MLNETKLEQLALSALSLAASASSETQVILQLLVKKNLVSVEEVKEMREYVATLPTYKEMADMIDKATQLNRESERFENLVEKTLMPGGNENLTKEEREYLLKKLDQFR